MKRLISFFLSLAVVFTNFAFLTNSIEAKGETVLPNINLEEFQDVRGMDLSGVDLRDKEELLFTLTFDNKTKWPSKDKLPKQFNPYALLEQGKDPGLGIRELQKLGYTGAGVTIAYVDQNLLLKHDAYENVKLHNYVVKDSSPTMHGPAVLSLLSGKDIGIAPNSEVYFFGNSGGKDNNKYEAISFEKIVEINKTLPENKKIRVVGMSHAADDFVNKEYAEHLRKAQEEARKSGIIVIDVTCNMATAGVMGFKDRNDYRNYELSNWEKKWNEAQLKGRLIVPADFRTTAMGYDNDISHYAYWSEGGFSWGVPFITGVIAMGLQINPNLTEKEAFEYLHKSAYNHLGGDFINPKGFLEMVRANCTNPRDISKDKDYRYFLYNKDKVNEEDLRYIKEYIGNFKDGADSILKDVSSYKNATEIYAMLKAEASERVGKLKGVQIFGTSEDVPAFNVKYKIKMKDSIDEGEDFKSDFFYSNFQSEEKYLNEKFNLYDAFENKENVNFIAQWPVARLPLNKGEFKEYMKKKDKYAKELSKMPFGNFVNFSNPIFPLKEHPDDMGYFLKERIDKEFNILSSEEYKLYGNKQGHYPVNTEVLGDFTRENLIKENKQGIKEFIINAHGQWDNIDQCIFTDSHKQSEKRISFLNRKNINETLSHNYYDLDLWTCLNAYNLSSENLVNTAMKGKCISAIAASSIISNNGVNNKAYIGDMQNNNFYYFYLNYLYNRSAGNTRSYSFYRAQKEYAKEILKNTDMLQNANYQFNIHNVLSYHYLGLLENWEVKGKEVFSPNVTEEEPFYGDIKLSGYCNEDVIQINSFKAHRENDKIKFTLNYTSTEDMGLSFFNPPEGDIIGKVFSDGIKKDNNIYEFYLTLEEFEKMLSVKSIYIKLGFEVDYGFLGFNPKQLTSLYLAP